MRKIIFFVFILFILSGCQNLFNTDSDSTDATDSTDTESDSYIMTDSGKRWVYNSCWDTQTLDTLSALLGLNTVKKSNSILDIFMQTVYADSVEISESSLESIITKLNAETTESQLFLESSEVSITEAPTCDVIVYDEIAVDGKYPILKEWDDQVRSTVKSNMSMWRLEAANLGGKLALDCVPTPTEETVVTISNYQLYAIYEIYTDDDGVQSIYYEEHAEDKYSDYWKTKYSTLKKFYNFRVRLIKLDATSLGSHYKCVADGYLHKIVDGVDTSYSE